MTSPRPIRLLFVAAVLVLGACTGPTATAPSPSTTPGPADQGRAGAPKVTSPRTFAGRDQDPCGSLLRDGQLTQLGVRPSTSAPGVLPSGTPECSWGLVREGRIVSVAAYGHRDYFVDAYRSRQFPIFLSTEIAGLPAVIQQSAATSVNCGVTTGIADGQALDVTVALFKGDDAARRSCDEAVAVSAAVISNLPPAS